MNDGPRDAPPPVPRPGHPQAVKIAGTRALWMGSLFVVLFAVASGVAARNQAFSLPLHGGLIALASAAAIAGAVLRPGGRVPLSTAAGRIVARRDTRWLWERRTIWVLYDPRDPRRSMPWY